MFFYLSKIEGGLTFSKSMTAIQESGTEKFFKKTVKPGKKWILEQVDRYDVNIDINIKP